MAFWSNGHFCLKNDHLILIMFTLHSETSTLFSLNHNFICTIKMFDSETIVNNNILISSDRVSLFSAHIKFSLLTNWICFYNSDSWITDIIFLQTCWAAVLNDQDKTWWTADQANVPISMESESCCPCSALYVIRSITGQQRVSNHWSMEQKTCLWILIDNEEAGLSDRWSITSQTDAELQLHLLRHAGDGKINTTTIIIQ